MKFPSSLRVASIPDNLYYNRSGGFAMLFDGYIMQYLAQRLKFQYELIEVDDSVDVIRKVYQGQADIGIALQSVNADYHRYVHFTVPYYKKDFSFMAERPGELPKYGAFWHPFSNDIWMALVVVALVATLLTKWITASKASLANVFVSIVGSMLRQPLNVDIASLEKIIWWSTWLVWATVMSTAYSSLFLSFLTAPGRERGVKNFEELSAAVERKEFSCLFIKALNPQFLLESPEQHLRTLGIAIAENSWYYDSHDNLPEIGPTRAVIGNREYLEILEYFPPNRIKVFSEDSLLVKPIVITVNRKFCCLEQLNVALQQITAAGLVNEVFKNHQFERKWRKELRAWEWPDIEDNVSALTMEDLKYVFFMLLMGHSVALLCFVCEVLMPKHREVWGRCHKFSKRHWKLKKKNGRVQPGR